MLALDFESGIMDVLNNLNAGKTQLVLLDVSRNSGDIDLKMDGSILDETDSYIVSIVKYTSNEIRAWTRSKKFRSLELALCLYKSTIWSYMEYCCYVCVGASNRYLEKLKLVSRAVGPLLLLLNASVIIQM